MTLDRTTRLLLGLIAAGLWLMLLKPGFAPQPSHAAGPERSGGPALEVVRNADGGIAAVYVAGDGKITRYDAVLRVQGSTI